MLARIFAGLALLFCLSFSVSAQVYVCDFGWKHPQVRVNAVILHAQAPLPQKEHRQVVTRISDVAKSIHSPEWGDLLRSDAEEMVKEAYQDRGYFKASVDAKLVRVSSHENVHVVNVVLHVEPGKHYRLAGISWKGNSAFSADELHNAMGLAVGEWFSRDRFADGLDAIHRLYLSRGYINYTPIPTPQFDEAKGSVAWEVDLDEGQQFLFGELDIHGLEEQHRQILLSAWNELRGKPFSRELANKFFNHFFVPLRAGITPKDYTHYSLDPAHGSVNCSMALNRNPALDTTIRPHQLQR